MKASGPMYRQIAAVLNQKIMSGEYAEHEAVPSEIELSRQFDVSRMTARQALNELVLEGKVYRVKGRGTYVSPFKYEKAIHGLTSFSEDMLLKGFTPSSKLIGCEKIKASDLVMKQLGLLLNEEVWQLTRIRFADNEPMALEVVYLPVKLVAQLPHDIANQSLYVFLEQQLGFVIDYSIQEIEAILTTDEISTFLNVPKQSACLRITLQSYLKNGQAFEYVESYYRADRYKFIQPAYRQSQG